MTRTRGDGMGARERADGRWEARTARDSNGRRRTVYGKTERAANDARRQAEREIAAGVAVPAGRLTVGAWLDTWLALHLNPDLAPRSVDDYRETCARYVRPFLGTRRLASLTRDDVVAWLADMAAHVGPRGAWSGTTRNHALAILRMALNEAVASGRIAANPATLAVKAPRKSTPKVNPWSPLEAATFLDHLEGDRFEPLATVAILAGLRQSELLGLTWADVDLDAATITVRAQLSRGSTTTRALVPVKTDGSADTVGVPGRVVEVLTTWRTVQKTERLAAGRRYQGNPLGLVFTNTEGGAWDHRNLARTFQAHVRAAKLPAQRFHDLRHQAATFQFVMGARETEVGAFLRHAKGSKMTARYTHLFEAQERAAATRMDTLFPRRRAEGAAE